MDVFLYSYARPEYLWLTLNSLCFHNEGRHSIHLAINKSSETKKKEDLKRDTRYTEEELRSALSFPIHLHYAGEKSLGK